MSFGRIIAPLLIAAFGALIFSGEALAGCVVVSGTIDVDCDVNERIDATATQPEPPATPPYPLSQLTVSDVHLQSTGSDDNGYLTFTATESGLDIELALTDGTTIKSDNYLGLDVRTNSGGDIKVTTEVGVTIEAEQTGIYAKATTVGDIEIINYAYVHSGLGTGDMGSEGIWAVSNGGATTIKNYAHVESDNGRGLYADGGYLEGAATVSIYNEGEVEAYGDALRAVAGGTFGTDAEITNYGEVTGHDRRGIVAWSASGDTTIENYGEVTSYGGQAIYGMANAGKVTITNDAILRVIDEDPETADLNDTSFAGIQAEVDGTGEIEVSNLDDGDILTYDNGIYAHTGSGKVKITNDGKIVAGEAGILSESADGDVTIENSGTILADGATCVCDDYTLGAVTVTGTDLGDVIVHNKTGGVIANNKSLSFVPTAEWLDAASTGDLSDLAELASNSFAIGGDIDSADSVTITNDGTVIGGIGIGTDDDEADFGTARIVNNGLWVSSLVAGFEDMTGVVENTGRWQTLGTTMVAGSIENSGDMVATSLSEEVGEYAAGMFLVYGDYNATGDARLVLQWPDQSLVGYAPMLGVMGEVTGTTEIVIGRGEALENFDWDGTKYIPVVVAMGTENADEGHFYMEETSYGMLNFNLLYDNGDGQSWYLALDTTEGTETLADIPFAARNLFKLATEGVGDRLDELRNAYASNGAPSGPLGYAASPDDPVTAALALSAPSRPSTNAWVKTTGRYAQGDGYDALSGVIEAGIDTLVDTGAGQLAYGAFGGTGAAQMGFDLADTEATITGPLLGGYANYSSDGAFLGVIGAVQSLTVDATLSGAAATFGGLTYGGRIDAGYRFGDELIVEPAIALAASHTEFDTFEMNAMDVGFVDTDSLAAEARLRVARDFAFEGVSVTPFAVATIGNDFLGGDGVDAPPSEVMMGNNGGLYGDLSAGVTVANEDETLSGFAKGNVGYAAGELSGGLRLGANAAF